mgnify:CR=1 FL=1
MLKSTLLSTLRPFKTRLILIVFLGFFWSLRDILTPYLVKKMIDTTYYSEVLPKVIFQSMILIVIAWGVMEICMRIQGRLLIRTLPPIRTALYEKLTNHVNEYPLSFFKRHFSGNLADKIQGAVLGSENLLSIYLSSFIPILSHLFFSLILITLISPKLGGIFLCWITFHLWVTWKMGLRSLEKTQLSAEARSNLQARILDSLFNIFAVKTFSRETHESNYLKSYLDEELNATQKAQDYLEKVRWVLGGSSLVMLITTLTLSYLEWEKEVLSLGSLTLVIMLLLNLTSFLWYLSMEVIRFKEEFGRVKENLEVLFSEIPEEKAKNQSFIPKGHLLLKNVTFGYDTPLIKDLSFSLSPGKSLAITGLSGSGKTTLIHLLLSHIQAETGKIEIDGTSINALSQVDVRNVFAVVPQNPSLFHRSIRDNLLYGNLSASEEDVLKALKTSNCYSFIEALPLGLDTIVGDRGDKLSGGQKQRIAIARALLKQSPILILDEPTASLDEEMGIATIKNVLGAAKKRALLVITHQKKIAALMDHQLHIQ